MNVGLSVNIEAATLGARQVLDAVSFDCSRGSHTAIVGPNGAGKTTLLRVIASLTPYLGQVTVDEESVAELPARQRSRRIAYVPQRSSLTAPLLVPAVVAQGRYCYTGGVSKLSATDQQAVEQAMAAMEVDSLSDRTFCEISGGEQRRVLIARALATGASVLLLDEPTAGLDVRHVLLLVSKLQELKATGKVIVSVLHDLQLAETQADQLVAMHEGRAVFTGAGPLSNRTIRSIYGVNRVASSAFRYEPL